MSQTKAQLIDAVDGSIVTADIADDAINADKLASNAVVNASVASNAAIAASKIADFVTGNTNNRVLTASGTANSLIGESGLLFTSDSNDHALTLTGSGQAHLRLTTTSGSDHCSIDFGDSDDNDIGEIRYTNSTNNMHFDTNATLRMTLDSSGRLLLGTSDVGNTDADDLTIANSAHAGITLRSGTSSQGAIYFSDATSGAAQYDGFIGYSHSDRALFFGSAQATRMRINSDGDLLVGRTTTIDTSEVFGIKGPSGDHCTFGISTDGTTNLGIVSFNDDDANFRGQLRYRHSSDQLEVFTAGTERFRFLSGGNFKLLDGDLVIGASGHGIDFSDTSDASGATSEILDDYEEGTWTADFNANISESQVSNRYVKIGRSVTAQFYVNIAGSFGGAAGASDTSLVISGLPYAAASNAFHTGVIDVGNGGAAGAYLRVSGGASTMSVLVGSGSVGTSRTHLRGNTIGTGDYVIGSITYQTA